MSQTVPNVSNYFSETTVNAWNKFKPYLIIWSIPLMFVGCTVGTVYAVNADNEARRERYVQQYKEAVKADQVYTQDLDKDGKPETLLQLDGKQYLLTKNADGSVSGTPFKIETKVIPTNGTIDDKVK